MTLPRQILPGTFYMVNRRCTQRQFLLRPDAATNNAITYCLGEAAQRFGIEVILPSAMSNHMHTVIFDRYGTLNQFTEHFHKMLAKCQNALRGRWENFWSSEQLCVVRLENPEDVMDKLVYAATNPVKDWLVERVCHWPGVNGLSSLLRQRSMRASRPHHFFRDSGSMPAEVTLPLTIPPELGARDDVLRDLRQRVAKVEVECARARAQTGRRIWGRRRVLRQSWRDSPFSREPRRDLRPRVAARSKWARIEALQRNRAFVIAYREARKAWLSGTPIPFPTGTYWLRRFAGVPLIGPWV
jgi:REP element-mobilizing transposase RayT